MMLLVDAGNTRVKWLLWDREAPLARGGLVHRGLERSRLGGLLWGDLQPPERVVIANVAGPELGDALAAWIAGAWSLEPRFVATAAAGFGITNAYAVPRRLGVDRWVALVGAHALLPGVPCCVVDCGTAVTVDALTGSGEHLGGVILPGARLMRQALYADTSQIPPEQGQTTLFGRDTQDCVWGGATYAVAAAVDRLTRQMTATLDEAAVSLLTGGDAEALLPYLESQYRLEPDLIFQGLLVMAGSQA